jgi:hypothetical protein
LIPASEDFPQFDKTNERRNAFSAESEEISPKGMLPPPTGFEPPKLLPTYNQEFRNREEARLKQLGLPIGQAKTQASQFVNQQPKIAPAFQPAPKPVVSQSSNFQSTKKPGTKTFDPDKNFKAFEHIFQPGLKFF